MVRRQHLGSVFFASVMVLGAIAGVPANASGDVRAADSSVLQPFRVFAIQVASTPVPVGARCHDHTFDAYSGASTCSGHGGVHYWIYPGSE